MRRIEQRLCEYCGFCSNKETQDSRSNEMTRTPRIARSIIMTLRLLNEAKGPKPSKCQFDFSSSPVHKCILDQSIHMYEWVYM